MEFPYFQSILSKYETSRFAILSINTEPDQDSRVLPMMRGYGFTLLKVPNRSWAKDYDDVRVAPTNYLLSADGEIIFQPRAHNKRTQQIIEQEIDLLLARASQVMTTFRSRARVGNNE